MADFAYTYGKLAIGLGDVHFDTDDIRLILCMTNTTADTEADKTFIDQFTTLDEFDGGGSHPPAFADREALANQAITADTANDRAEFDADNHTISSIPAGSRNIQGVIVYWHTGSDAASIPLLWIDSGGFPFTANGGDLVLSWNAEGIAQIT